VLGVNDIHTRFEATGQPGNRSTSSALFGSNNSRQVAESKNREGVSSKLQQPSILERFKGAIGSNGSENKESEQQSSSGRASFKFPFFSQDSSDNKESVKTSEKIRRSDREELDSLIDEVVDE